TFFPGRSARSQRNATVCAAALDLPTAIFATNSCLSPVVNRLNDSRSPTSSVPSSVKRIACKRTSLLGCTSTMICSKAPASLRITTGGTCRDVATVASTPAWAQELPRDNSPTSPALITNVRLISRLLTLNHPDCGQFSHEASRKPLFANRAGG